MSGKQPFYRHPLFFFLAILAVLMAAGWLYPAKVPYTQDELSQRRIDSR